MQQKKYSYLWSLGGDWWHTILSQSAQHTTVQLVQLYLRGTHRRLRCNHSTAAFIQRYQKWCKRHSYNLQIKPGGWAPRWITGFNRHASQERLDQDHDPAGYWFAECCFYISGAAQGWNVYLCSTTSGISCCYGHAQRRWFSEISAHGWDWEITHFTYRNAITAFAGVDPGANQSGIYYEANSVKTSKNGPPKLRKTLFLMMDCLLKT